MFRGLLDRLGLRRGEAWHQILPYQPLGDVSADVRSVAAVYAGLRPEEYRRTPTAVYLTPAGLGRSPLAPLAARYPGDAGLKLLTTPADGVAAQMLLTADLLHLSEIGPRVYDLTRVRIGRAVTPAFVVQHREGRPPEPHEWEDVLGRLRRLDEASLIRPRSAAGWTDPAFLHPDAHAVVRVSGEGRISWDGFEHLTLSDYGPFVERLAVEMAGDTHPGDGARGSQGYLYQSVPGVQLPARRKVEGRMAIIRELLAAARVSLADRLVLDIGCNFGIAMAHYLHLGARWCHGWDLPVIVSQAERMLLALGCTRFSTTAGRITAAQPVEGDLPPFLLPALRGCVVSYLAIRGHVGWVEALGRIPWAVLIYEGHRSEGEAALVEHLAALERLTPFVRGAIRLHRDGPRSRPRPLTVLVRPENL